jgi:hypothetical protein
MENSIEIYDNVIDDKTIVMLKELIKQNIDERTKTIYDFKNPVINRTEHIECKLGLFIHNLLLELNDNTKYIEFWIHISNNGIGFHKDCDDVLLTKDNTLIMPEKAHILYLDNIIYYPTILLNNDNMIISPNVSGRLTRFNGSLYHSVGIPDINFMNKNKIIENSRNVILFNTWTEENYKNSSFTYNPNPYKNENTHILCNKITMWTKIQPIINLSPILNYKLFFKFLRNKKQRITENTDNLFNDKQIERGILEFNVSSEFINYYNNKILTPLLMNYLSN